LLLVFSAIALLWANSPFRDDYTQLWDTPMGIRLGEFEFERSLAWVVNDGLMVIFFFVVGMEIRREVHHGELSELRRASLPLAGALGGMLVPAGLYLAFAGGPETHSGWGVPMATDIAFAIGILTLLGKRVPPALRVLLLAVAVIDDLGAIMVIAIFYSSGVALAGFGVAAAGLAALFAMQRLGIRNKLAYVVPGVIVWAGIYSAGVHPTIAGVILGVMTPVRAWLGPEGFIRGVREDLDILSRTPVEALSTHAFASVLQHVDDARREALSPAESLIETLHPWVAYGIMPVFALANAGVHIEAGALTASAWTAGLGVSIGLLVGKPLGIVLFSAITLRLGIAKLPQGMTMSHILVLGMVSGVGFTMALFIAPLAFSDAALLSAAKLGVLVASGLAAVLSLVLGRLLLKEYGPEAAASADEAESSTEK